MFLSVLVEHLSRTFVQSHAGTGRKGINSHTSIRKRGESRPRKNNEENVEDLKHYSFIDSLVSKLIASNNITVKGKGGNYRVVCFFLIV